MIESLKSLDLVMVVGDETYMVPTNLQVRACSLVAEVMFIMMQEWFLQMALFSWY